MSRPNNSSIGRIRRKSMRSALTLARRGYGLTSPNPMVGAILVKNGRIIGRGWHCGPGRPHAEIEALDDARRHGHDPRGAELYVTLEPCSTFGRTPPCTDAIIAAGIRRVIIGAVDPNPRHRGKAFSILKRAGIAVTRGVLAGDSSRLNEAFNHWIVRRTPFVTVKAALTLDGKIATAAGESKWITGEAARAYGMKLRHGADAVLVGVNTILADDPSLTLRAVRSPRSTVHSRNRLRRIILDALARTPLTAKVVRDKSAAFTTVVVSKEAPASRVAALSKRVRVMTAPLAPSVRRDGSPAIDLRWLLKRLGAEEVTSLLVEGGGEVHASFLLGGLAHRVAFFYAPRILGGRQARRAVAGVGAGRLSQAARLRELHWQKLGADLLLTARVSESLATGKGQSPECRHVYGHC